MVCEMNNKSIIFATMSALSFCITASTQAESVKSNNIIYDIAGIELGEDIKASKSKASKLNENYKIDYRNDEKGEVLAILYISTVPNPECQANTCHREINDDVFLLLPGSNGKLFGAARYIDKVVPYSKLKMALVAKYGNPSHEGFRELRWDFNRDGTADQDYSRQSCERLTDSAGSINLRQSRLPNAQFASVQNLTSTCAYSVLLRYKENFDSSKLKDPEKLLVDGYSIHVFDAKAFYDEAVALDNAEQAIKDEAMRQKAEDASKEDLGL